MENNKKLILFFLSFIILLAFNCLSIGANAQSIELYEETNCNDEQFKNSTQTTQADDWTLVWADEFDGTGENINENGIDLSKWGFQEGTGEQYGLVGWGNNEQQYYRKENAFIEDGKLIIEARKEDFNGMNYTSSRLFTANTFTKKYGRFEARIKLPEGQGFWPAFWLLPKEEAYGGWAASGEIDIMEVKGRIPNEVMGTIHYGGSWPNNVYNGGKYVFPDNQDITDFHEYAIEWEPGEIRWYVDDNLYLTLNNWYSENENNAAKYSFPAPFNQEFYIILNLAIGGNFDGGLLPPDDLFPARMEVDYVRVYELTGREYKKTIEPTIQKEELPEDSKLPLEDGNWIYDVNYEQSFTIVDDNAKPLDDKYWNLVYAPEFGGKASISVDKLDNSNFAKIDIQNGGNQNYSVQLIQNVTLGKGRIYKLSFDAKASSPRSINVKLGSGADRGWMLYSKDKKISLTDELKTYELIFMMDKDTDTKARLEFNLGLDTNSVWIGNVNLKEVDYLFDEEALKEPLPDGNHIYNGTFDQGYIHSMTFWDFISNNSKANASVDDDYKLKVSIENTGNNPDSIKMIQKGIELKNDIEYKVIFDAYSTIDRPIKIEIENSNSDKYLDEIVNLSQQIKTYELTFTMPKDDIVTFEFLMGKFAEITDTKPHDIYIDNVKLIKIN
ncbi:carbohydrate binding domain-containing protein [Defluviitalea phaphyphila]|uniref:carbohydrate binding domain-containing protein n=1 Tax=Defluviitalea phaphyphila TaxID=1473580 RepID=UPI00073103B8|nr:carbohydrate binding domain-containing protein [Defluviitalea phaphyphila]